MGKLTDKFIGLDQYGEQVSLNYRGEGAYKTRCGASLSLVTIFLLLVFTYKNGLKMVHRDSPSVTITNVVLDISNDDTTYDLHHDHFTPIIETSYLDQATQTTKYGIPEKYARIVAFEHAIPSSVTGDDRLLFKADEYEIDQDKEVPWVTCDRRHLSKVDSEKVDGVLQQLRNAKCLDLNQQKISGGNNPEFDLLERSVVVKLQYCDFYTHSDV